MVKKKVSKKDNKNLRNWVIGIVVAGLILWVALSYSGSGSSDEEGLESLNPLSGDVCQNEWDKYIDTQDLADDLFDDYEDCINPTDDVPDSCSPEGTGEYCGCLQAAPVRKWYEKSGITEYGCKNSDDPLIVFIPYYKDGDEEDCASELSFNNCIEHTENPKCRWNANVDPRCVEINSDTPCFKQTFVICQELKNLDNHCQWIAGFGCVDEDPNPASICGCYTDENEVVISGFNDCKTYLSEGLCTDGTHRCKVTNIITGFEEFRDCTMYIIT